jgi:adenine-specific DNA-methyltransferase
VALVEQLMAKVPDDALRKALEREVADLKKRLNWGLVFERHIPETVRLLHAPVRPGSIVWERQATKPKRYRVRAVEGDDVVAVLEPEGQTAAEGARTARLDRGSLLVEKAFAEPVHSTLHSLGDSRYGPDDRPAHAVIEAENFHALQLLAFTFREQVDVAYLDPPYNTGARDWKYNNDFVDGKDCWKHSKWLSFMERRLRLTRAMLKRDGVMVVTVDEHEVHHLGMLLEQTFPDARIQMVTIVINASGVDQGGLSRVEEYAFFVFFGNAPKPLGLGDDMLAEERNIRTRDSRIRWEQLLRGGEGSAREANPRLFYPVLIEADSDRIIGVGEPVTDLEQVPDLDALIDGKRAVWPVRENNTWGRWRNSPATMRRLIEKDYVRLGGYDATRRTHVIYYVSDKVRKQIENGVINVSGHDDNGAVLLEYASIPETAVKTVWRRVRHNAGMSGSQLLLAFMGRQGSFPYPKSLYAVRDTLDILLRDKPDALIVDPFAGSGTTLHATMLLNSEDGGRRRCILVTNNEVDDQLARRLHRAGHFRGDPEYEKNGIFEAVTRPRVEAALTGNRPDGVPVIGEYRDGRPYSDGFTENVEWFRLDYLDAAEVELGLRSADLLPVWWLQAGSVGKRTALTDDAPFSVPPGTRYAFLFDPRGVTGLLAALEERPDVTHVYVLAETDDAFAELASQMPPGKTVSLLYRPYLDALRGMGA